MKTSPTVWSRFTRTIDGTETKFRIQEVSEAWYEKILDLFMKYHTPDEPIQILTGLPKNERALEELRCLLLEKMMYERQQILVCCLDDDSDEIKPVGASKMAVIERSAAKLVHKHQIQTKEVQNFFTIVDSMYSTYNVLKEHHLVDAYFADRGLVVHPAYRRMGIAEELLKARAKVCSLHSISLYTGLATAIGSQRAAEKLGAKAVRELNIEDFAKDVGLITDGPLVVKLMVGKIPECT